MNKNITFSMQPEEFREMIREIIFDELLPALIEKTKKGVNDKDYYTRHEVCKILSISLGTLHSRTLKGQILSQKLGRRILYKKDDIDNCLTTRKFRP
jgi:sialic acid synthase SpsE